MPRGKLQQNIFTVTSEETTCFYADKDLCGLLDVAGLLSRVHTREGGKPIVQEAFSDGCFRQLDTAEYDSILERMLCGAGFITVYDIDYDRNTFCAVRWERGSLKAWTVELDKVICVYNEALAGTDQDQIAASKKRMQKAIHAILDVGAIQFSTRFPTDGAPSTSEQNHGPQMAM